MHKLALEIDDSVYQKFMDFIKQLPTKTVVLIEDDDTIMTKEDIAAYNKAIAEYNVGDVYTLEQAKKELLGEV